MTVNSTDSRFTRTHRKLTAILSIATIGFGMMTTGLLESNSSAETGTTIGNFTVEPYYVNPPMGETAAGPSTQSDLLMEGANASTSIPLFSEFLPAFLFFGGLVAVIAVAYIDYTRVHPEN